MLAGGGKAAAHLLLPGLARAVALLDVAGAEEHADGAVARLEALLHVQRHPRGCAPRPRRGRRCRPGIPQRAHVGFARHRSALKILRQQAIGAADRDIGVIVGAHHADAGIHPDLVADRPVDDRDSSPSRSCCSTRAVTAARGEREDDREIFRPRARHHGVHGHFLDGEFPEFAEGGRPQPADDLVGLVARRP